MLDQTLVWNTDRNLQVTSLTARLRDLANIGNATALHVSELWGSDDPYNPAMVAHHWALDGEHLSFEATVRNGRFRFELQPLHDISGATIGVAGRAVEFQQSTHLHSEALRHAERVTGMGTWHEDLRTGLITISEGLAMLLGVEHGAQPFNIRVFDHEADRERVAREISQQSRDEYVCDHRVCCPGSRLRTVRERVRTIVDERGIAIARIGTLLDISDLKDREAELSELALFDALTRLPNRASLEERLADALARCERDNRSCALLFADLDDFKAINDAYGHDFGDRVLASVAQRLNRHVRATDMVARLGGDEFVIVIEDLYSNEAALDAARKLLRSLDEPFFVEDRTIRISASIGVATYPGAGTTPRELLQLADREMYAVKRNGGSGVKLAPQKERAFPTDENSSCQAHSSPDRHRYATLESA